MEEWYKAIAVRDICSLRAINHPLIIKIEDIVKDDDNHPYIIMEKCE